jgi:hypothetical protein
MTETKCDMCKVKPAVRFNETLRRPDGHGSIVNVCYKCMDRLIAQNRTSANVSSSSNYQGGLV